MDDKNMKAEAYSIFKEQLALMISEEECQVVKEVAVQSSKKEKKTALAILLGEDDADDDSTVFTMSEEFDKYLKETP